MNNKKCVKYYLEYSNFGQIVYSPLKDVGFVPERNSEIFVNSIPEEATIYDVIRFFEQAGNLLKVKLMMQPNANRNRGFAFVTFMNAMFAQKALTVLKNEPFLYNRPLNMCISVNNCRIFVGGVPTDKTKDQIWQELIKTYNVDHLLDVITYRNSRNLMLNRGFVFLEFRSHEDAARFRAMYQGNLMLFGKRLRVDWSIPNSDPKVPSTNPRNKRNSQCFQTGTQPNQPSLFNHVRERQNSFEDSDSSIFSQNLPRWEEFQHFELPKETFSEENTFSLLSPASSSFSPIISRPPSASVRKTDALLHNLEKLLSDLGLK